MADKTRQVGGARPGAGRPSLYSEDIAETICSRLIEGESLRQICSGDDMPDRRTVLRWLDQNSEFAAKYARARTMQADLMDDLILETAVSCTAESFQADRVRIAAFQWRASKLKPKVYGDKMTTELTGPDGGPVRTITGAMTPQEAAEAYADMLKEGDG